MSNDSFWYNPCHLAGPTSSLIHLPRDMVTTSSTGAGSGSSSQPSLEHYASQFLQKIYGNDTHPADQYTIPPYLRFPFDIDHDVAVEIVQPFIGPLAHGTHEASVPLVLSVNMSGSYCTEDRDLADPQAQTLDTIEDTGPNEAVAIDPRFAWLSFHRHAGAFSQLSSLLSLETLDGSAESHQVVTPTLQDPKDSHRESTNFSHVPSPYAPMPLPPIFSFESQSKMMDITIDAASSSHSLFCPVQDDKCFPIDPVQASYTYTEPAPTVDADNTFARGRTRSECLWPPSLSAEYQLPQRCPKTLSNATDIPLDVAERQAEEFRAIGPSTLLSLPFLMTFMGQPTEHSPWQCYIRGCGKTLTRKSHMVDHIRMHLNERVYACDTCPQTFLRKADCKRHALAHNPDKAFRCNSCPKSFGRKDLLTRHSRGCKPNDEWVPSNDLKEQRSKRKGIQRTSILDTTGVQDDMAFITPSILLSPPEGFKSGGKRTLGFHGEDKENIPPFLLPSGPMFSHPCGADPEGKRKKARTRI